MLQKLTNQYPIQKTIRFALRPIGETCQHIKNNGLLEADEELARKYKLTKQIIDEYHKYFIDSRLSSFTLDIDILESLHVAYTTLKKDRKDKEASKNYTKLQDQLRKSISTVLKDPRLFKEFAKFFKNDLPQWLQEKQLSDNPIIIDGIDNPIEVIQEFKNWTSYFGGFNENRKNIYTDKEHSTAISYRLIHDNLPKFLDNIDRYQLAKELGVDFSEVESTFAVELDQVFSLEYFNNCLTQQGIDRYNQIRGGQATAIDEKQQGINEKINLYAQTLQNKKETAPDDQKQELETRRRRARSCTLEELYKQILSDRDEVSFRVEALTDDAELCQHIQQQFTVKGDDLIHQQGTTESAFPIFKSLDTTLESLKTANPTQVYLKNSADLSSISKQLFGDWSIIKNSLEHYAKTAKLGKNAKGEEKTLASTEQKSWLKASYLSIDGIHHALELFFQQYPDEELDSGQEGITREIKEKALSKPLISYFTTLPINTKGITDTQAEKPSALNLKQQILQSYAAVATVLEQYQQQNIEESQEKQQKNRLKNNASAIATIKEHLDAIMALQHFLKPLFVETSKSDAKSADSYLKDSSFYDGFDQLYRALQAIVPLYNQTRNYLTQKPFSTEKYKLNFENNTLAKGWDKNKETDNSCVLFLRDGKYFLGVMAKGHNKIFAQDMPEDVKDSYQKVVYKQVANPALDIHTLINENGKVKRYTGKNLDAKRREHCPNIHAIKEKESYKGTAIIRSDLDAFIDYYKECVSLYPSWSWCKFSFKETHDYKNLADFTDDINRQGYEITFQNIAADYMDQCVQEGKLYLFEIYSKDFSKKSTGKPNLQTLYWRELFSPTNLKDVVYKLNGGAELFFRQASLHYSEEIWKKGHHAADPKKKQRYPIIKDKRYAQDTFLFHVPISCNFKATQGNNRFNDRVNALLKNNPDINILGIDRGERHLAYYTLIDQQGNILQDKEGTHIQGSLNNPLGNKDYHQLLDNKEKERGSARKSWGTIEKIKDLKQGYLSQVVHKICQLVIEHNAIIVFEDLNFGFKRGRFKVEKQVYQKLEKMLIDKLNYLVFFKDKDKALEAGGVRNALQLTEPFTSFKDMGKQTGIIFYVPAYHTSKVCPATGFVNLLYPRYETVNKAQAFFSKFDNIAYNAEKDYFEFSFNYKNFSGKIKGCKPDWTVCTYGKRLENYRNKEQNNQWDTREVELTEGLKELFKDNEIDYQQTGSQPKNLVEAISQKTDKQFFIGLMRFLRLTLQLRNSKTNSDEDWMISPVQDEQGNFYYSPESEGNMPQNADANGAYHIGLKGLWALQKIAETEEGKHPKLAITNEQWYTFVQDKPYKSS